jgi:hypothetical protein
MRIPRRRADFVLVSRQAEQEHGGHAVAAGTRRLLHRLVHRQLEHPRHRRHLAADALALAHEQRVDEHVGREPRLDTEL